MFIKLAAPIQTNALRFPPPDHLSHYSLFDSAQQKQCQETKRIELIYHISLIFSKTGASSMVASRSQGRTPSTNVLPISFFKTPASHLLLDSLHPSALGSSLLSRRRWGIRLFYSTNAPPDIALPSHLTVVSRMWRLELRRLVICW